MINSNFGFTPLKEVWIGDCYPSSWYDHLSNEIADPFRQITEWTKEYPPLTEWLYKRGINVHCFDLRTGTFWDGGWHCFTLDINRVDSKTNLFSSDNQTGVQWKLN